MAAATKTFLPPSPSSAPPRFRDASEWLHALGDVPPERIRFDPWPGTATEADVLRLDAREGRLCELVEGTLVEKAVGFEESQIAMLVGSILLQFAKAHNLGIVAGEAGMIRMTGGNIRIPDVSFIAYADLPGGKAPGMPVPEIVPTLAVEILSEGNTKKEMSNKIAEYFASGGRRVWVLDPKAKTLDDYTSPDNSRQLTAGDTLDGGNVLPGFSVEVGDLFEV